MFTLRTRIQRDTKQIKQVLGTLVQANEVDHWMSAPNVMLDGVRPFDKIKQGKTRQVTEILARLEEGIHMFRLAISFIVCV